MTNNEETYKGKQALIIAGCRPPHIGHKDMVDQVEEQGFSKLIWIVGEYQSEPSFRNPFYGSERKEMKEKRKEKRKDRREKRKNKD